MEKDSRHEDRYFLQDRVSDLPDRVLGTPAYAAFGDAVPGSALPPGTYPSSPSDSNKKAETPPKEKTSSSGTSTQQQGGKKTQKKAPKKGR